MARHHTALHRAFNLKPIAFQLMKGLTSPHPSLRRAASFFPEFGWPEENRVSIREDSVHRFRLLEDRYSRQRAFIGEHNVDVMNPVCLFPDPNEARRVLALVSDVLVPGHTLTPVDASTGTQLAFDMRAQSNWNFAYPAPTVLRTRHVGGIVAAIPPFKHYGHLLTDVLMPLCYALHQGALPAGETLTLATARQPSPLILSFIEGLRRTGVAVAHLELSPWERVQADSYLYARSHCPNVERIFGTPEALDYARSVFRAAYADRALPEPAPRIYLTRGETRLRQVAGEAELIEGLRKRGFRIVQASWANHHEQVHWFAEAEIAMAVHGAGLANILWARRQPLLIELMSQNGRKSTGLHWAAEAGADYEPVAGGPEGAKQSFAIDPDAVLRAVDAAIERRGASRTS
jgi:phosphoglycolate phosphatase-like HAD superfamily hydrolase